MKKSTKIVIFLLTVLFVFSFSFGCSCSEENQTENIDKYSIEVDDKLTIERYEAGRVLPVITKKNDEKVEANDLAFQSKDENVLLIDENGVIIPKNIGLSEVTVSWKGKSAVCIVTVVEKNVPVLQVQPKTLGFINNISEPFQIIANVFYNNEIVDVGKASISYKIEEGGESIVSVNENGLVSPLRCGKTKIIVSATYGEYSGLGMTQEIPITVSSDVEVQLLYSAEEIETLYLRELIGSNGNYYSSVEYDYLVKHHNAQGNLVEDETAIVSWISSNENVAYIDSTGKLSALSAGTTLIWCEYIDKDGDVSVSEKKEVKVKANAILSFDVNGGLGHLDPISVLIGEPLGSLPKPTKEGFEFVGWKVDGEIIDEEIVWDIDADKTAVAEYIEMETVTYMVGDVEIGRETVAKGSCCNSNMSKYSSKWKLNNEDFDLETPINEDVILVSEMKDAFNFYGENSDTQSYIMSGGSKFDLKRSEQTLWGISRPVGRPEYNSRIYCGGNRIVGFWQFITTTDIIDIFKSAGYTKLVFKVVIYADEKLTGSSISFLNESVVVDGIANDEVKEVSIDIDDFKEWIASGQKTSFVATCGIKNTGRLAVGDFMFQRDTISVTYKYKDTIIGVSEVEQNCTVENDGIIGFSTQWQLNGVDYNLATPVTQNITLVATGDIFSEFKFEGENSDTVSFELVNGNKFDLKRTNGTALGIENPVGRPEVAHRVSCGGVAIAGYWKFILTPEIVKAFIALGYTNLTFKVTVKAYSGSLNECSVYFFGSNNATATGLISGQPIDISLSLTEFLKWMENQNTVPFIRIVGFASGTMAMFGVGEFNFAK